MLSLILSGLIVLSFLVSVILFFKAKTDQEELILSINENSQKLAQRSQELRELEHQLKEQPNKLNKAEQEHVMNEINKISKLWKSRRERLKEGLWKRMEKGSETEEKIKKPQEDEISTLNHQKERIRNLMKKAKIEYRKRKIDEVSFREIMRDYQKELMEIDVRLSELENP